MKLIHQLIIFDMKIGYLKIKFQKVRFLNYFEAKRKGLRSTVSESISQMGIDDGNISCFVESVASHRSCSTKSKVSTLRVIQEQHKLNNRTTSQFSSQSRRYRSPILQGRIVDYNEQEKRSIDKIAEITKMMSDLKAKTNRPVHLNGTPIFNEKYGKRVIFGK